MVGVVHLLIWEGVGAVEQICFGLLFWDGVGGVHLYYAGLDAVLFFCWVVGLDAVRFS